MKKRILPALLAAAMLIGCSGQNMMITDQNGKTISVSANEKNTYTFKLPLGEGNESNWKNPFLDVNEKDWFYLPIRFCHENKFISGTSTNMFHPNTPASRAMIVTILWRLDGSPITGANSFTDVPSDQYYAAAVSWAVERGIISGYSTNLFAPEDNINREQMASILYRYAEYHGWDTSAGNTLNNFTDGHTTSAYAKNALCWATSHKIINGIENHRLNPHGEATRAQIASVLRSFYLNVML